MTQLFDQSFWDDLYRTREALWSGNPNRILTAETERLVPGRALEIGAGEGADAIWLAWRGWHVTAVDLSAVALERAAAHAASAGGGIATRIDWVHQDLTDWEPIHLHYDLVTAHYFHLAPDARRKLFDRLGSAVALGGTLLIVGHGHTESTSHSMMPENFRFSGDDVADRLDPGQWHIVTKAVVTVAPGRPEVPPDVVVRACRYGLPQS
jgi:SAM-dependent methyltransferase